MCKETFSVVDSSVFSVNRSTDIDVRGSRCFQVANRDVNAILEKTNCSDSPRRSLGEQ